MSSKKQESSRTKPTYPLPYRDWTVEEHEGLSSFRRVCEALKTKVTASDAVQNVIGAEVSGYRPKINCPLPDHEDKTPSFVLYTETDSWYCFGCLRGGDVIEFWKLAHGMSSKWESLVALANEFGIELPQRSRGWKDGRSRRQKMRDAKITALSERWRKRAFETVEMSWIREIEDPDVRRETLIDVWEVWCRFVPFRIWTEALIARCEERRTRWEMEDV